MMMARFFLWALIFTLAAIASPASAQKYRDSQTTAAEIAALPKYCYEQYVSSKLKGDPMYSIQGCGVYMNHLCPGLIKMMRVKREATHISIRKELVGQAIVDFNYTLNFMPPSCQMRGEVERLLEEAERVKGGLR